MKNLMAVIILLGLLTAAPVWAEPTPVVTKLLWDVYTDADGVGFMLYWAMQKEPEPRVYDDTRRIDISRPNPEQIIILNVHPSAKKAMCFKLTAYNSLGNESAFSNEVCGYLGGLEVPNNLRK